MVLTEWDDVGGLLLGTAAGMTFLFWAVIVLERRVLGSTAETSGPMRSASVNEGSRGGLSHRGRLGWVSSAPWLLPIFAVGVLTWAVLDERTLTFDAATLRGPVAADQSWLAHGVARTLVMGGQSWLVGSGLLIAAAVRVRHRSWRPLLASVTALAALSFVLWVLKVVTGRSSPHSGDNDVMTNGMSFPSGHAAVAALCLPLIALLIADARGWTQQQQRVAVRSGSAGAAVVGLCTLVLGYHWITDVIAGLALGAGFAWVTARSMRLGRPEAR